MHSFYQEVLNDEIGSGISLYSATPIGGGCIHNGTKLVTSKGNFFLKWNNSSTPDMFEKEAEGLNLLSSVGIFTIPRPISFGKLEGKYFLLMEYIESSSKIGGYWSDFGQKLALLHQNTEGRFGLDHDNYIGSLPQYNKHQKSWGEFFVKMRIQPQLDIAIKNRLADHSLMEALAKLYQKIPEILPNEKPSLLHGDLWSGNVMTDSEGKVCLIDPAVYYGHREIELAFTTLFGGFNSKFYHSYDEAFPRSPGFMERIDLYNIYPLLVHLNLFGSSYYGSVMRSIMRYI